MLSLASTSFKILSVRYTSRECVKILKNVVQFFFLDAFSHFYKWLYPSVGLFVRPSVCWFVTNPFVKLWKQRVLCPFEFVDGLRLSVRPFEGPL